MEKYSRRDFLKKAAIYAGGAAVLTIPGCGIGPRYLILDSGHGGNETGTVFAGHQLSKIPGLSGIIKNGIGNTVKAWAEDEVAYDVLCRVYNNDGGNDGFGVVPIIKDWSTGYNAINNLKTSRANKNEYIVYKNEKLHRWKMGDKEYNIPKRVEVINKLYHRMINDGVPRDNIYFISIHADEAPSGSEGAFAIYPIVRSDYGGYTANRKSKKLKNRLRDSFRSHRLKTKAGFGYEENHKGLFRSDLEQKVILEIGNMSSMDDVERLNDSAYRDKIAKAIIDAVKY